MTKKYKAKIDAQYRDGQGKIRSYQAGQVLDWQTGMPEPSKHFERIGGDPSPAPPIKPPAVELVPGPPNAGGEQLPPIVPEAPAGIPPRQTQSRPRNTGRRT